MSLTKRQIQTLRDLHTKVGRLSQQLFVIEGEKLVSERLFDPEGIETLYHTSRFTLPPKHRANKVVAVSDQEMQRVSALKAASPVLATVRLPNERSVQSPKIIYGCGIQDPGNLGTMIRIADWFGIEDLILTEGSVDAFSPKVVQASMGSIFRVNCRYDLECDLLNDLKADGYHVYGADMQGCKFSEITTHPKSILLMGSESHGISEQMLPLVDTFVAIPKLGNGDSLNVGVACGILAHWMTM